MAGRRKSWTPELSRSAKRIPHLYAYQKAWVDDESRFKVCCKARQIGFTFAATLRAVLKRVARPGLTLWLSASERQALEAMEQVRRHVRMLGVRASFGEELIEGTAQRQQRVSFPNGSRILALPANPDTARGFAGDIILDEFAFHRDDSAIWRAAFATATRGFQLEVISTPNGTQGKYYELARAAGLVGTGNVNRETGIVGGKQSGSRFTVHESRSPWSGHWCDIYSARAAGFTVDVEALRAAVADDDLWRQEYCCEFLSDAAAYLPLELIIPAEFDHTTVPVSRFPVPDARPAGPCYLGVDIGRARDKTVLWLLEDVDGILWTRLVRTLDRAPFSVQRAAIEEVLTERPVPSDLRPVPTGHGSRVTGHFLVQRCAIDATGIGAMLAEELAARFGARVEPVVFTLATKEDLALRLKRLLEERRLRIPYDPEIRRALAAVKRYTTALGHFRFDAARTEEGHADAFWALALACSAAEHSVLSTEFVPTQLPSAFRQATAF